MFFRLKFYIGVIESLGFIKGIMFLIRKHLKINKVVNYPNVAHPIHLRPRTSDQGVFIQVFLGNEYNLDEIKIGFEPQVIIDGGANIGLATVYFRNKYPNAKIIAIEPDEGNMAQLKINVAAYDNISVKQAGIWSKKTKTEISDKYGLGSWGMVLKETDNENGMPTLSIADIMEEYGLTHIDLLKLDIETAEKQVFSENYMTWLPKTKVLVVELHDWMTKGCSKPFFTAINEAFTSYSFYQKGENTIVINEDLVKAFHLD